MTEDWVQKQRARRKTFLRECEAVSAADIPHHYDLNGMSHERHAVLAFIEQCKPTDRASEEAIGDLARCGVTSTEVLLAVAAWIERRDDSLALAAAVTRLRLAIRDVAAWEMKVDATGASDDDPPGIGGFGPDDPPDSLEP